MDIKKNRLYPYPVLAYYNSDFCESEFFVEVEVDQQEENVGIHFNVTLVNDELKEMIKNQMAVLAFHVENPITCYRKIFETGEEKFLIRIPSEKLNGRISICSFIISSNAIPNYSNNKFNSDYEGASFSITRGNILGIAPQVKIHIDKARNELEKMPSIFSIIRTDEAESQVMKIEIASEKIKLFLEKSVFETYQLLSMNGNYLPVLHSALIFPALVYALDSIQYEGVEEYEDYRWFRSIKKNMNKQGLELNSEQIRMKTSFVLAQELLNYPIVKGFEKLLAEGNDED